MASSTTSKTRVRAEQADDRARNERQKLVLLIEQRKLLKGSRKKLMEANSELAVKTKKLIAVSKRSIKRFEIT